MVALVSGASEDFTVAAVIPMFRHLSLHGDDFRGKISHFGYSEMMILLLSNFKGLFDCGRPFDWPVDTRPVAVS